MDPSTPKGETYIGKFDEAIIEAKANELNDGMTIEQQYDNLRVAIGHAIQNALPSKKRGKSIVQKVSRRTRDLYDKRTQLSKNKAKRTKAEYKEIQEQIKQSSLQDHADWVRE